mmetsp:Transcript_46800/g.123250  ORF Transcript_46800/g.123250 Transcript_46800/m.123250 type:complete len:294 (+) Transcript_46800:51-932(+)
MSSALTELRTDTRGLPPDSQAAPSSEPSTPSAPAAVAAPMVAAAPTAPVHVISLSLTEDYAPSWGVWEGTRELVQNWHDGCVEHAAAGGGSIQWEALTGRGGGGSGGGGQPEGLQRYEARTASGVAVGTCVYDGTLRQLLLVNRGAAIERRALLLGTSRKAHAAESIGQFGEGMKVGALALLREGRAVQMQTRDEQWAWARREDPAFGVRVLTVEVRPRDAGAAAVSAELHGAEEEEAVEAPPPSSNGTKKRRKSAAAEEAAPATPVANGAKQKKKKAAAEAPAAAEAAVDVE